MKLFKRTLKTGVVSFYLDDYHNGVRIRETLGVKIPPGMDPVYVKNQRRLAEQLFQARQAELLLARKGIVRDDALSLAAYAERFAPGRDPQDHVVRVLPYLREHFGPLELRAVDYRACESFQAYLSTKAVSSRTKRGLGPKTVKHYFNALAFILNEAVRDRYLERSPASSVRRVRVADKVVIALTPDELETLWACPMAFPLGPVVKTAFFFAVNAGLRVGDVRSLRWGDIQTGPDGWRLVKAQDKTGNQITVPLNQNVRDLLNSRFSLDPKAFVFPEFQTVANVVRYVPEWAAAAGLKKRVTFHTARHTFGTLLSQAGGNALVVQNLLGHTTRKMTEHYTQAAGGEARGLVDSLPRLTAGSKA